MPIITAQSFSEAYKARASAVNINELNGRGDFNELTRFIAENIASNLKILPKDTVVDIGCGDCSFFKQLKIKMKNIDDLTLIGILPNVEEINNVQNHLNSDDDLKTLPINLLKGKLGNLGLAKNTADFIVLNSVLHGVVSNLSDAMKVFMEIKEILKFDGVFYLGEVPTCDELSGRNYDKNSIFGWLIWILKNRGFVAFLKNILIVTKSLISNHNFIIEPKERFFILPDVLIEKAQTLGFTCIKNMRHKQIDRGGNVSYSPTRWNYIFKLAKN